MNGLKHIEFNSTDKITTHIHNIEDFRYHFLYTPQFDVTVFCIISVLVHRGSRGVWVKKLEVAHYKLLVMGMSDCPHKTKLCFIVKEQFKSRRVLLLSTCIIKEGLSTHGKTKALNQLHGLF